MTNRPLATFLAVLLAAAASVWDSPAHAHPAAAPEPSIADGLVLAQSAQCDRVRAFCRGRFYGGPDFRLCVVRNGCAVAVRPSARYCAQQRQICRNRWGGGPRFRACVNRRGC